MTHTRFIQRSHADAPSFKDLPGWFSSLLYARGIQTEEQAQRFLNPSLDFLRDPFLLPGMTETVSLLRSAIAEGKTILVYGDYDADGVCAASILMDVLHEEGAALAYRIPSRHTEGYGLNPEAVREIARKALPFPASRTGCPPFSAPAGSPRTRRPGVFFPLPCPACMIPFSCPAWRKRSAC